jgi:hypothetical protein
MRNMRHAEIKSRPTDEMQLEDGFQRRKPPKRTDVFDGIRNPAADFIDKSRQQFAHKIMYGEYASTKNDRNETNEGLDQMDSREDIMMAFEPVEDTLDQPDLSKRRQETRIRKTSEPNQGDIFDIIMGKVEAAFCLSSDIPATSNPWPVPSETDILDEIFHIVETALCLSSSAFDKIESLSLRNGNVNDNLLDGTIVDGRELDALDKFFEGIEDAICPKETAILEEAFTDLKEDWYLGEDTPFDCIVESKENTSKELAPARTQSFLGGLMTELICFSACTPKHEALSMDNYESIESLQKLPGRSHRQQHPPSAVGDTVQAIRNEDTPALLPQTIFSERCRERFDERYRDLLLQV